MARSGHELLSVTCRHPTNPQLSTKRGGRAGWQSRATWERSGVGLGKRHVVWRITGALGAASLLAYTAQMAGAAPAPSAGAPGAGSVTTDVVLPSVTVTDPVGGVEPAALGTVGTTATSRGALHALLNVQGLAVLGQSGPSYAVDSAGGNKSGDFTIPVAAGPLTARIQSGQYDVDAGAGTATSRVSLLTGDLHTTVVEVSAGLGQHGLSSVVTPTQSSGALDATLGSLSLDLGNLLPAGVLSALPLSALLNLLNALHLPVPANLDGAVTTVTALPAQLTALQGDVGGVASAAAKAVKSDLATLAAAQTKASTCQRDPVCAATQLPALVAAAGAAQAQLATDSANLQTLQGAVAGTPAVAAAQAALDRAVATLVNLLGSLSNQLVNLPDLTTLLEQLLGALKGAPLLGVKDVGVSLSAVADGASGTATAACSAGSVTLLGTAVVAPTCDALRQQLQSVHSAVSAALAALPLAAGITPHVAVDGLVTSPSGTTRPAGDGTASSSAGITPLHVGVGSVTLASVVDSLVSGLLGQLQQVGATVDSLTGGVAGVVLPAQASGALGTVSTQLATLTAQLQALPTGAALGGLRTIGLDASLGGAGAQASFLPSPPSPASPAAPSTPSAAPDPRPGVEIPRSLPRTGGTRTLELVALGLLLLVGGWQLLEMAATAAGRRPGTGASVPCG